MIGLKIQSDGPILSYPRFRVCAFHRVLAQETSQEFVAGVASSLGILEYLLFLGHDV